MNYNEINRIRTVTKQKSGIIHCITNPISINQCANAVLAAGAKPMMAQHPQEVAEITATAQALMLNMGNITDTRMQSMILSAQAAKKNGIPFIIDAVGICCSQLRRGFITDFLGSFSPAVIKGNYSEINALCNADYSSAGVDADATLDITYIADNAVELAKKYNAVVLASGKTDIVTDGKKLVYIKNGTHQLAQITGTGCMLGALCACYLSADSGIGAAVTACAVLGISGQLAKTEKGSGTFMVNLMDRLSTLKDEDMEKLLDMEVYELE